MATTKTVPEPINTYSSDRYAMYLRKSRADIELEAMGEGETLARHKKMLDALAAKHEIHPDQIEIYKEVVSGESIDDRPEAQRLLRDVSKKKFKAALVVEVERLARGNTTDQGVVADAFTASHTKIITPSKVYDPDNEYDQEYFEFGLFMARREYKTIRRRLVAGKQQSVMEGNYILSKDVYGYTAVRKSKKDRILVPVPEKAKVVQMIFDWFTEDGKKFTWIAKQLTSMGIPTPSGKRKEWHPTSIRDILNNVHYIGKVSWGEQSTVKVFDEKKGKMVKKRQFGEKEIYEGKHDGIISEEQFEKAQKMLKNNNPDAPVKKGFTLRNPLSGILKCPDCGTNIIYTPYPSRNTTPRFEHKALLSCKKKSVREDILIDNIINSLKAHIDDLTVKMESGHDQSELVRHQEMIKAMEAELAKLNAMKQRMFDSWDANDGTYTREEFIERKQKYNSAIEEIKKQIQEAKLNAPEPVDYSQQIENLHAAIDCIKNPDISAQDKNDFLKQVIDHIDYNVIDLGYRKGCIPVLDVHLKL